MLEVQEGQMVGVQVVEEEEEEERVIGIPLFPLQASSINFSLKKTAQFRIVDTRYV